MEAWRHETDLGIHELSKHRPRAALGHLSRALERCPRSRNGDLVRVLFYLGMTMRKLGMLNPALRSWIICRKLSKRGFGSKMAERYSNDYGMERQRSAEEDDWQAFRSVQVKRYLGNRDPARFESSLEAGFVTDMIWERWIELKSTHELPTMPPADKCALFRGVSVPYPWSETTQPGSTIPVSFRAQKRVSYDDRCPCGSGRPFRVCCGRTVGTDEIACGVF